jgi:hypothetical protein
LKLALNLDLESTFDKLPLLLVLNPVYIFCSYISRF